MSPDPDRVVVAPPGADRLLAGHLWVFRNQIQIQDSAPEPGAVVRVVDTRGRFHGMAFYSAESAIALRLLTRSERRIDGEFLREVVRGAVARREPAVRGAHAYRLLHGEADGLPATVADFYAGHVVLQTLAAGSDRLTTEIAQAISDVIAPESILLRNDPAVRRLEGLPREVRQLRGQTPARIPVREGSIQLLVDPWHGQKTGLFLDQRDNRIALEPMGAHTVLDCFSYEGGFALHAALLAREVLAVDVSAAGLEKAAEHARRNGFDQLRTLEGNAFDVLRSLAAGGQRFDLVILDPPAFAKNRAALPGALRGYKEINLRAMKLLAPGGHLVTASCSYHLSEADFEVILRDAAADARRTVRVVARRGQGLDHPVLLGVPETAYLKCWTLRVE
jgi:23S rRNA (cytosine1962-C5)-methyltransferase